MEFEEFPHMHIQVCEDSYVMKVLGKIPVTVKSEQELFETFKKWAKEVRKKNWVK